MSTGSAFCKYFESLSNTRAGASGFSVSNWPHIRRCPFQIDPIGVFLWRIGTNWGSSISPISFATLSFVGRRNGRWAEAGKETVAKNHSDTIGRFISARSLSCQGITRIPQNRYLLWNISRKTFTAIVRYPPGVVELLLQSRCLVSSLHSHFFDSPTGRFPTFFSHLTWFYQVGAKYRKQYWRFTFI